jgi:poly(3-hydroxyalkanoate) synthetase
MKTRYFNNEAAISWETIILDGRAAVNFLKTQRGITKIVLLGASNGGALMSSYQAGNPATLSPHSTSLLAPHKANNESYVDGTVNLRSFLSLRAVRGMNSMDNLDLESVNNSTGANLKLVSVPLLQPGRF